MILPSFIIIENFYEDPDKVREYALQQIYNYSPDYPGKRCASYYPNHIHSALKTILSPYFSNVNVQTGSFNGEFQITTKNDVSWIHQDKSNATDQTTIAGVCFLTPNPPLDSGTIFFEKDLKNDYIQTDMINNKYNRLILFNGHIHHISGKYFGSTDNDSRLTQVFFLDCS